MSASPKSPGESPALDAPPARHAGGAILLDGKAVAAKVRAEVAQRSAEFLARHVARKLGRTAAAVQQKAMRAGISFRAAKRSGARRKK